MTAAVFAANAAKHTWFTSNRCFHTKNFFSWLRFDHLSSAKA